MLKRLSLLLIIGLLIACGNDDSTSPPAIPVQSHVAAANSMTEDMASFLDIIVAATGTAVHYENGVWIWTYAEGASTYTVTCEYQSDGWCCTLVVDGGIYADCLRADGFTSTSESSGWWKFYEFANGSVAFSAT